MTRVLAVVLGLLVVGCGERGVDWSAPESFILREKSTEQGDGVQLEYWSLVDATCRAIYDTLVDVEHYPEFIPGVDTAQIIARTDTTKTVLIAQRVISHQSSAKVEWSFDPGPPRLEFKTLTSDFAFNDGRYTFEASPDGKRCLVHTTFVVKPAPGGNPIPLKVLAQATRDTFLAATGGVKKRVTGAAK